jgi:hypothetical protein
MKNCANCIHFGTLKGHAGVELGHLCLAPVTTEPPKDGVTQAKNPFVYEATAEGCCEMWTPELPEQPRPPLSDEFKMAQEYARSHFGSATAFRVGIAFAALGYPMPTLPSLPYPHDSKLAIHFEKGYKQHAINERLRQATEA